MAVIILLGTTAAVVVFLVEVLDQTDVPELAPTIEGCIARKEAALREDSRKAGEPGSVWAKVPEGIAELPGPPGVVAADLFWTGAFLLAGATAFLAISAQAIYQRARAGFPLFPAWQSAAVVTSAQVIAVLGALAGMLAIAASYSQNLGA
jgi:hypothetical protein